MATVVRVKRRINEDPLDILFFSHKKAKTENQLVAKDAHQHSESVLKFAGRVTSKVVHPNPMSLVFVVLK